MEPENNVVIPRQAQNSAGNDPKGVSTQQVPEYWPNVPVIAINKHPVFPKFIKIIEVSDKRLVECIREKVHLNIPYAGVFVKKDDNNVSEVCSSQDELYPIGSFVQIMEIQDLGNKLRMVVMAHRRITYEETLVAENATEEMKHALMAKTENYEHEPYENTDEIKALTQEIIKTIRDIIVSSTLHSGFCSGFLFQTVKQKSTTKSTAQWSQSLWRGEYNLD